MDAKGAIINSTESPEEPCYKVNKKAEGLSWWIASLYLAGEMIGSGLLVLPKVFDWSGWIGLLVFVLFACSVAYMTTLLARNRLIIMDNFPRYNGFVRDPYTSMGYCTFGYPGKILVAVCLKGHLFGGSVTLMLLGSQITQSILKIDSLNYCQWILIYGIVLTPLMWFATPKDFWGVGIGSFIATIIIVILMFISVINDTRNDNMTRFDSVPSFGSFCKAFATMTFIFGGISIFPSVHSDMKNKNSYAITIFSLFSCMLLVYLPISILSYMKYGSNVNVNVIMSLPQGMLRTTIEILLVVHFLLAFLIVINPVCLEFEELFNVAHTLCWKRCALRTTLMSSILLIGLSVPSFSKVMTLIGAAFGTITTFVCPVAVYLRLMYTHCHGAISLHELVYLIEVLVVAILGCFCATYFAVKDILDPERYTIPCFMF